MRDQSERPDHLGAFTDRQAALAAVEELLAPTGQARVLVVTGVTGQGKTRLIDQIIDLHGHRFRPVRVDLQSVVLEGLGGHDDARLMAGADDVAVYLLRAIAGGLVAHARWWQRRPRLRDRAKRVGTDPTARVENRVSATSGGIVWNSPTTTYVGVAPVDSVRRGTWVGQLAAIAHRLRRRPVLLTVDTCEWVHVFDGLPPSTGQTSLGRPTALASWFTGQLLPALLDAAPRMRIVLAGWDDLSLPRRVPAVRHRLTGWSMNDTRTFLVSTGIVDRTVLDLLVDLVHKTPTGDADVVEDTQAEAEGLPAIADLLARAAGALPGTGVERAQLLRRMRDEPAHVWVPDLILRRLSRRQKREFIAAVVLREVTVPALQALLPEIDSQDIDWFTVLTGRAFLQPLPELGGEQRRWRVHLLLRRWLLDHLAATDGLAADGTEVLPALHARAAGYYRALAARAPGRWDLEIAYHCFAIGDDAPASAWQNRMLTAAHSERSDAVVAHVDAALAPEHAAGLPGRLPAVAAVAYACAGWVDYRRGRHAEAESHATTAADLYGQLGDTAGQAWALCLAGQAAWTAWRWSDAAGHWTRTLTTHTADTPLADQITLLAALVEVSLGCGDLRAGATHAAQARALLTCPASEPSDPAEPEELPAIALASAIPAERLPAWLTLREAEATLYTGDHGQAGRLLDCVDLLTAHPVESAELLRLRAELALAADQPLAAADAVAQAAAVTAAGDPPQLRIRILLTQAAVEQRLATYGSSSHASTIYADGQRVHTISLDGSSAARHHLAQQYRAAAFDLATTTAHQHLRARTLNATRNYHTALTLFQYLGDRHGHADALAGLGETARDQGDLDVATRYFTEARTLYDQIGQRHGQADTLVGLGETALQRGDLDVATGYFTEARTLYDQIGQRHGQADTLVGLGETALQQGDLDTAATRFDAARTLYAKIGNRLGQAHSVRGLGETALQRSDLDSATSHLTAARIVYGQIGDRYGQANALRRLGETILQRGDLDTATRHFTEACTLYEEIRDRAGQANALRGLGDTARMRGDLDTATGHLAAARAVYDQIGDRLGQANALRGLGETARMRGALDAATSDFTEARTLYDQIGNRLGQANALLGLGETARMRGDLDTAGGHFTEARSLYDQIGNRLGQANALLGLGETARMRGDLDIASSHCTEARTLYKEIRDRLGQANALRMLGDIAILQERPTNARILLLQAADLYYAIGFTVKANQIRRKIHAQNE